MTRYRRSLAAVALVLGALAAVVGTPAPRGSSVDIEALARAVEREDDHVTAVELATWIKDRKPGLRVIDVRPAADFERYHLPTAERMALDTLVSTSFENDETVVMYSDGGAHAAQAWVFLRARGHRQVYFLRGGLADWLDQVMNPAIAPGTPPDTRARVVAISRYFGGTPHDETDADRAVKSEAPRTSTAEAIARMRRRGC